MSVDGFDRLLGDLRTNAELCKELEALGNDPEAWVRWGTAKGYDITAADVAKLREMFDDEVSDDDLEKVAGGWCGNDLTVS